MATEAEASDTLDLESGETRNPDTVSIGAIEAPSSPKEEKFDEKKSTDQARKYIAYALLALLFIIVIAALFSVGAINSEAVDSNATGNVMANDAKADADRLVSVLNILFGPVVTLLGTATGFYFGSQARTPTPVPPSGK